MAQEEKKHPKAFCDNKVRFCRTCLFRHFDCLYKAKTDPEFKDAFIKIEAYWNIIEIRKLYFDQFNETVAESSMAPQLPGILNFQEPYNIFLDMFLKLGEIRHDN
jgi:hypothetical protein